MTKSTAHCVVEAGNLLGEGPRWNGREQRLYWIDVNAKTLHQYDPSTGQASVQDTPWGATSFAFRAEGDLLMNYLRGPKIWSARTGDGYAFDLTGISPDERFNDNRCDSRGRCWTGTFHRGLKEPLGHLYRIGTDRRITRMDDGVMMSNGLAWSPDDKTLYYCDSWPGLVFAYEFDADDGALGAKRLHMDLSAQGHPDGCVMDAEGCLWIAEVDRWRVARYTPAGRLDAVIAVPTIKPTSLTFGGPDLKTLYITSRRSGLSEAQLAEQPLAGALFACDVAVGGLPEHDYAG